jgi:hypothetical protein
MSIHQSLPGFQGGYKLTAGEKGSEQRTQRQNGGRDVKLLLILWTFAGPSEESVFLSKPSFRGRSFSAPTSPGHHSKTLFLPLPLSEKLLSLYLDLKEKR